LLFHKCNVRVVHQIYVLVCLRGAQSTFAQFALAVAYRLLELNLEHARVKFADDATSIVLGYFAFIPTPILLLY
jgi:hypothetical protein